MRTHYAINGSVGLQSIFLVVILACSALPLVFLSKVNGQESPVLLEDEDLPAFVQALRQIDRDYVDFLNKRSRIQESYAQALKILRDTEQDLQRIENESIRQQMAAFQARLRSLQMDAMLAESRRRADGRDNAENRRPNSPLANQRPELKSWTQDALAQEKTAAELQFSLRGAELQQLDATGQAVVRRRLENLQRASALEQEHIQWMIDWPKFMDRYWGYSDFERTWNLDQIQEAIKVLNLAHQENLAAMLVCARLKCRVGLTDEALALVERVLDAETPLNAVATAIKAEVLTASGKEGAGKAALQAALKLDNENAYVRWIRAELLADQKQYSIVEPIWKSFLNVRDFELPARSRLAMLYFNRAASSKSKKSESDLSRAVKEAELALELQVKPSWQPYLIYGIALYGIGKNEEALGQVAKASDRASGEALALCREWEQRIKDGEVAAWVYFRTFEKE
jgi:hypothetical protein